MKLIGKILASLVGVVVLVTTAVCGWLYLYTSDLPLVSELGQYDPKTPTEIHSGPNPAVHAVPSDRIAKHFALAIVAAEGQPESRGPIHVAFAGFLSDIKPNRRMYSLQIARDMLGSERTIRRQIDELRLAQQIQRRFSQQQVLAIYMNRVYLGQSTYGVEDASIRYFGKNASDLSLDEAAVLAGLIRSPNRDSPIEHPERAVERRNWVIDQMNSQGSVSPEDAEKAKNAPLIVKRTANSEASYDFNRCALSLATIGSPGNTEIRFRPGDKTTKQTPVITFEVLESGEIKNAAVFRSSGISDIDNYALTSIKTSRYNVRPPGCGLIESQATVNVDFSVVSTHALSR